MEIKKTTVLVRDLVDGYRDNDEEGVVGYNEVIVNVQSGGGGVVLPNGIKFRTSSFSTLPEGFDFSQITDFSNMFNKSGYIKKIRPR